MYVFNLIFVAFAAGVLEAYANQNSLSGASSETWSSDVQNEDALITTAFNSTSDRMSTLALSSIQSTEQFTTLSHPDLPGHRVRIKKTEFCDLTVKYVNNLYEHERRHANPIL